MKWKIPPSFSIYLAGRNLHDREKARYRTCGFCYSPKIRQSQVPYFSHPFSPFISRDYRYFSDASALGISPFLSYFFQYYFLNFFLLRREAYIKLSSFQVIIWYCWKLEKNNRKFNTNANLYPGGLMRCGYFLLQCSQSSSVLESQLFEKDNLF